MKYLVLTVLLLTGCAFKGDPLENKRLARELCYDTNAKRVITEDIDVECYQQTQTVRLIQ